MTYYLRLSAPWLCRNPAPSCFCAATDDRDSRSRSILVIHFRIPLMMLAAAGLIAATASAPGQTPASKAYLFNVARKQTFTEIGSDDKTRPEFVGDFSGLAGKAVKVAFFKGDSVGDRVARVSNWMPFTTLRLASSTRVRKRSRLD